jgi:putative thioredoxin
MVEFMGVWSEPCVAMADIFSGLATEFAGQFIFAKVDVDEQPALREQYKIENIPSMLVFNNGEIVRREVGQLNEQEARSLLRDFAIFNQTDQIREQAREKHIAGNTQEAILLLTDAIKQDPSNTRIAMDMVQIFIDIGQIVDAQGLFDRLPAKDQQSEMGKLLKGQLWFHELKTKTAGTEELTQRVAITKDDFDARFDLSICLVAEHQYQAALEQLFYVIERDINYRDGAAKEMIATLTNMLRASEPALAEDFRRKLSNLLAS